jgi:hypothetical protein
MRSPTSATKATESLLQPPRWLIVAMLLLAPAGGRSDVLGDLTGLREARSMPQGRAEVMVSAAMVREEGIDFFHSRQDRVSIPRLYAAYGVGGKTYIDASWDYRFVDDRRTGKANGSGDLRLATQVEISNRAWRPTHLAARVLVKLPNADETLSLGTNETDVLGWIIASHGIFANWRVLGHIGIEILGDSTESAVQDDVATGGIGLDHENGPWHTRLALTSRRATSNGNGGTQVICATQRIIRPGLAWVAAGQVGIDGLAADWGIQLGIVMSRDDSDDAE